MTLSEAYAIMYHKFFIRENHLEQDLRKHFMKKGYSQSVTDTSKHMLLFMLEQSTIDDKTIRAIRRVVRGFQDRKDLNRYEGIKDGIEKYIVNNCIKPYEIQIFKKKWVVYNNSGKIISFYPNWNEDGNLDRNGKGNIRHSIGEIIFHKVDCPSFTMPPKLSSITVIKSGTEVSIDNVEMDIIRPIIIHMNSNEITYT